MASFETITGFPDETNENFVSDPPGFHYTAQANALMHLFSVDVDANNDAIDGVTVPVVDNVATAVQFRKGGAGYISATNRGASTRAKLAPSPIFFEIPLSMLFDTIKI